MRNILSINSSKAFCGCLAVALLLTEMVTADAAEVNVDARQAGSRVAIGMSAKVRASRDIVWAVLTDYEGAPAWVPGMKQSRVLSRDGNEATVSQKGDADFVLFSMAVEAVLKVREFPPDRITVKSLQGSFRFMEGAYRITPLADKSDEGKDTAKAFTKVEWIGQLEPDFSLPDFMTVSLVRRNVQTQFEGLVWEMERRERASKGLATPPRPGSQSAPRGGEF